MAHAHDDMPCATWGGTHRERVGFMGTPGVLPGTTGPVLMLVGQFSKSKAALFFLGTF